MAKVWVKLAMAAAVVGLAGCATYQPIGTVMPQADGSYRLVSTGRTESDALRVAQQDAKGTCKEDGKKRFVVVNQNSEYVGPNLEASGKSGAGGAALKLLQIAATHENKENYKVEMLVTCR